jgi:hypothetical protein
MVRVLLHLSLAFKLHVIIKQRLLFYTFLDFLSFIHEAFLITGSFGPTLTLDFTVKWLVCEVKRA